MQVLHAVTEVAAFCRSSIHWASSLLPFLLKPPTPSALYSGGVPRSGPSFRSSWPQWRARTRSFISLLFTFCLGHSPATVWACAAPPSRAPLTTLTPGPWFFLTGPHLHRAPPHTSVACGFISICSVFGQGPYPELPSSPTKGAVGRERLRNVLILMGNACLLWIQLQSTYEAIIYQRERQ